MALWSVFFESLNGAGDSHHLCVQVEILAEIESAASWKKDCR